MCELLGWKLVLRSIELADSRNFHHHAGYIRSRQYYQRPDCNLSSSSNENIVFPQGRHLVLALYGRQALAVAAGSRATKAP
ncbi:hypothetical protein NK553_07615 [Pseudomonas sp. ZM23]|uniref:Uncharacterized protein n=1 Tax=Pseudomonas triclosanedens TaxID=2961893 RepID=A0ABY7A0R6_9PSED|nr:hypothetical protein [Pseudomonas triclosanedens]MCP8463810.1 hypothetical protein [Pseudomonas triclosanedens]MCP8468894.1 hypothetical protein [Pseudomonas triclosanedens]MCP8475616.1 hypothetical protein [Pseudomonas triclosanedens]WAI50668.1 hypothetical protein OU419_05235 [Pseudomonas triclosanedens]